MWWRICLGPYSLGCVHLDVDLYGLIMIVLVGIVLLIKQNHLGWWPGVEVHSHRSPSSVVFEVPGSRRATDAPLTLGWWPHDSGHWTPLAPPLQIALAPGGAVLTIAFRFPLKDQWFWRLYGHAQGQVATPGRPLHSFLLSERKSQKYSDLKLFKACLVMIYYEKSQNHNVQ